MGDMSKDSQKNKNELGSNTVEKVSTTSLDLGNEDIQKLNEIFPNVFDEGKLDIEKLKNFLGDKCINEKVIEKYSLNWAGKSNAFKAIRVPSTGTLARDHKGVEEDDSENIFIEGDNLEVLRLLQKHYYSKIKMIYIDPPYNTGKDFVYKDNWTEDIDSYYKLTGQTDENGIKMTANTEKNGRFHSDWLTMMYPRLFLARNLLKDDGVIFVSIDDNEVANLRLIMDEIFGEENFVGTLIWKKTENIKMDSKFFSENKDYIICYKKQNIEEFNKILSTEERYNLEDEKGKYYLRKLDGKNGYTKGLDYVIEFNNIKYYPGGSFEKWEKRQNEGGASKDPRWLWSKEKVEEGLKNNDIVFKNGNVYNKVRYDGIAKKPYTDFLDVSSGQSSQQQFNNLFDGDRLFDHPKPIDLVEELLKMVSDDSDDIILDFFAGSGTTAHAVMDLNAEDGGNRKWICVQLPELTDEKSEAYKAGYKTISEISRERIKRAGKKIKEENKDKKDLDLGFKTFTLEKSNYRMWNVLGENDTKENVIAQAKLFTEKPLVDNYKEIDVVNEILLKEGFDLNSKVEKKDDVYVVTQKDNDEEKRIFITFKKKVTEIDVAKLKLTENDTFVCLDSALSDTDKTNISREKFNLKVI